MPLTRIQSLGITDGTIVNADINASAAIASTKLSGVANTPAFHARMSADQTLTNATSAKVAFNTEEFDTASAFDTSTYRFTVPSGQAGKYFIYASITAKSDDVPSSITLNSMSIFKNGSSISDTRMDIRNGGSGYYLSAYQHIALSLAVSDYIEIFTFVVLLSGTPKIHNLGSSHTNSFGGFKIIE